MVPDSSRPRRARKDAETVDEIFSRSGTAGIVGFDAAERYRAVPADAVLVVHGGAFAVHAAIVFPRLPAVSDMLVEPTVGASRDTDGRLVVTVPDDATCLRHLLAVIYAVAEGTITRLHRVSEPPDVELRARMAVFPDGAVTLAKKYGAWGEWMRAVVGRCIDGMCDEAFLVPAFGPARSFADEGDVLPEEMAWLVRFLTLCGGPVELVQRRLRLVQRPRWATVGDSTWSLDEYPMESWLLSLMRSVR